MSVQNPNTRSVDAVSIGKRARKKRERKLLKKNRLDIGEVMLF